MSNNHKFVGKGYTTNGLFKLNLSKKVGSSSIYMIGSYDL